MRTFAITALSVALLSGCAAVNKQTIDPHAVASLKNQDVAQTTRNKPDFAAVTPGKALFAVVGALAMISEGNQIVATNNIADPADAIASGIAESLAQTHGGRHVPQAVSVTSGEAEHISGAASGKGRFIVDVQTLNWSIVYFPTALTHYRVVYVGKARLIDVDSRKVIAEGACRHGGDATSQDAPTYDEFLANDAALLKKSLQGIATACVKTLNAEMLSI